MLSSLQLRDAHPDYNAAKSGSAEAATRLVADLLTNDLLLSQIADICAGTGATLVPAAAIEADGFNAIPDAMALEIGRRLGMPSDSEAIFQVNVVGHTRASGFHRLANPAVFAGPVVPGGRYFLVDDHVGMGGTLANLRGHIETQGGLVLGACTLSESRDGRRLALRIETFKLLRAKHGRDLESWWREALGHGFDCLTEAEAGYLLRAPTAERIRNHISRRAASLGHGSA